MISAERGLAAAPTPAPAAPPVRSFGSMTRPAIVFALGMIALALGYQMHFALQSAPLFLRFAGEPSLPWLMPVFWIGFNISMFPAGLVTNRLGGYTVMGVAALIGALAIIATHLAQGLDQMVIAQFVAGGAWGAILMSAFTVAFAIGENGGEGRMSGLLFSALALATLARWRGGEWLYRRSRVQGGAAMAADRLLGGGGGGLALSRRRRRQTLDGAMSEPKPTEVAMRVRTIGSFSIPSTLRRSARRTSMPASRLSSPAGCANYTDGMPFTIVVHLPAEEATRRRPPRIGEAFAHYFELSRAGGRAGTARTVPHRPALAGDRRRGADRLPGRQSVAGRAMPNEVVARVLEESLIIVGWVANWRPIEIWLYDWLPIRRRIQLNRRIAGGPGGGEGGVAACDDHARRSTARVWLSLPPACRRADRVATFFSAPSRMVAGWPARADDFGLLLRGAGRHVRVLALLGLRHVAGTEADVTVDD